MVEDLLILSQSLSKYAIGVEGNISCKFKDGFFIKASGKSLYNLKSSDLVFCEFDGSFKDFGLKPSIETSFHRWLLTNLDINFIAHTHPTNTLKILCGNKTETFSKSRMFPDQVVFNGPESCTVEYSHPGDELSENIKESVISYIKKHNQNPKLILLKNHGIVTIGKTINECIISTDMCEKSADIFLGSFPDINYLSDKNIDKIINDDKEKYRQSIINEE